MSLILRVMFPGGIVQGNKYKMMKFSPDTTLQGVQDEIITSNKIKYGESYTLYLPGSQSVKPRWPAETATLSSLNLSTNDTIFLRPKHHLAKTFIVHGPKASDIEVKDVLFLLPEKVGNWLEFLGIKYGFDVSQGYELFIRGLPNPLSKTATFREQAISINAQFVIRQSRMKCDLDMLNAAENAISPTKVAASAKKEKGVDWQSAASALTNPDMKGPISMRPMQGKKPKGKWERKYVVIQEKIMFCYKNPTATRPMCIYPLLGSSMNVLEDNPKKKLFVFEFIPAEGDTFQCRVPDAAMLKGWTTAITNPGGGRASGGSAGSTESEREGGGKKLFGAPLSSAVSVQDGSELPVLVEDAIRYIEERALEVVGIFRLSGSAITIDKYKAMYDKGERVDLSQEVDPHAVAGLMKLYFRELPEPLLTFELYQYFIAAADAPKVGCDKQLVLAYAKYLIQKLPPLNVALLKKLIGFLQHVSQYSEVNKMALHNLATVFAPNLLSKKDSNMFEMVEDTPQINSIVNTMIMEYQSIFENTEETDFKSIGGTIAKALYDYEPQREEEIALAKGDLVHIINQSQSGWWIGECGGKFGKFPGSYVQVMSNEARDGAMRKQKFMVDYAQVKRDLEKEKTLLAKLTEEEVTLKKELSELADKQVKLDASAKELRALLCSEFEGGQLRGFMFEVDGLIDKMKSCEANAEPISYTKGQLMQGLENLNKTLTTPDKKKDKKKEKSKDVVVNVVNQIWNKFIGDDLARKNLMEIRVKMYRDLLDLRLLLNHLMDP